MLDDVRQCGECARADIVGRTGLGRAIVVQRISDLLALGLVVEGERGASTGGRAPRTVRFNPGVGRCWPPTSAPPASTPPVADLAGTLLAHRHEPIDVTAGPEPVLSTVSELFDGLLARCATDGPLWGVGLGVPGPVEFGTGRVVAPPIMPGWANHPIRERPTERYDAPVWVDNDFNVLTLGELRAGAARGRTNALMVKLGTGIGAASSSRDCCAAVPRDPRATSGTRRSPTTRP